MRAISFSPLFLLVKNVCGASDIVMEDALAEMVGTLEIMSKNYVGETCSEFRALVLGIGNTRESLEAWCNFKSDNKDVEAIGWRLEHDLSEFVRWKTTV